MTPMGGRTRARQSDRDAVVDALSAAYADGQIGADAHALRVSSARPGGNLPEADPDLVDLSDLDAARLVSNVETAASTLGVAGDLQVTVKVTDAYPTMLNATVDPGDPVPPHVEILLSNRFMETATLTTDLSGREVLRKDAFAG